MSGPLPEPAPPRVLILRALGLGDFLTGVPAYRALRAAYPGHEIVLAAPAGLAPLAALTGAVDRVLATGELEPVPWRGPPPAAAADLHGNGPASHDLVRAVGAPVTMMYASPADPGVAGPWWAEEEHEVDRWCRLLQPRHLMGPGPEHGRPRYVVRKLGVPLLSREELLHHPEIQVIR